MKRWAEHFNELLNRPAPSTTPEIFPAEVDLDISCERPSKEEIRRAIKHLKSGKAAGPDHIPPEALKADINTTVEILYKLFEAIWIEEVVPNDWKLGDLIKIPKKGDLQNCDNYRGISLLSVPGKVLNRVVLERLRVAVDPNLRENQAGFRKGRSRTDQIATLRIIIKQSIEWNSALFVNFIDFEKAFDSLES